MATRVCHTPGCPHLTTDRSRLCDQHLTEQRQRVDAQRPNAHHRGYDQAHRADRPPAGTTCTTPGCHITTSLHRDHIDGNPTNNQPGNIQWLCATHHSRKTLTHDIQRDTNGRILPKQRGTPNPPSNRARAVEL